MLDGVVTGVMTSGHPLSGMLKKFNEMKKGWMVKEMVEEMVGLRRLNGEEVFYSWKISSSQTEGSEMTSSIHFFGVLAASGGLC